MLCVNRILCNACELVGARDRRQCITVHRSILYIAILFDVMLYGYEAHEQSVSRTLSETVLSHAGKITFAL